MSKISSAEDAYRAIEQEILCFVGSRNWESAKAMHQVFTTSTATKWSVVSTGEETRKGNLPPFEAASVASDAVLYLRDDLLKTTGQRIWGLTFTLYPDGKFNIEYDFDKPEDYEETEESVDLSQALEDFQKQGVDISKK